MERAEAVELLGTTEHLKRTTRAASRRYWFPLVVFGLITLAAMPLYAEPPASQTFFRVSYVGGFREGLGSYWLLATMAGYLATVLYYRWRDRRIGVAGHIRPFVITGLALFAVLIVSSPQGLALLGLPTWLSLWQGAPYEYLIMRGLSPILPIALGLVVLAVFERSRAFVAYCIAFLGLSLLVVIDDLDSFTARLGLGQHGVEANVFIAGVALLAGGIGFYLAGRRRA